jgi:cytochrome P450
MLVTDSPAHDAVRSLWTKSFNGGRAAARRHELEELADSLLASALSQLQRGAIVDLVPLFKEFAGKVVLDLLNFRHELGAGGLQTLSRLFDCYLKSKRSPRIEFCQRACAWFDRERRWQRYTTKSNVNVSNTTYRRPHATASSNESARSTRGWRHYGA